MVSSLRSRREMIGVAAAVFRGGLQLAINFQCASRWLVPKPTRMTAQHCSFTCLSPVSARTSGLAKAWPLGMRSEPLKLPRCQACPNQSGRASNQSCATPRLEACPCVQHLNPGGGETTNDHEPGSFCCTHETYEAATNIPRS